MGVLILCAPDKENDMRIRILGMVTSLMVLSACTPVSLGPTQTFTPSATITDEPTRQPTGTLPPTVTAKPTATEQIFFPEPVGEPAAEWKGFPIMPEAIAGKGDEEGYLYSVLATKEEVEDFYNRTLPGLGWELLGEGKAEVGDSVLFIYKQEANFLTISILPTREEGKVLVMLIK